MVNRLVFDDQKGEPCSDSPKDGVYGKGSRILLRLSGTFSSSKEHQRYRLLTNTLDEVLVVYLEQLFGKQD